MAGRVELEEAPVCETGLGCEKGVEGIEGVEGVEEPDPPPLNNPRKGLVPLGAATLVKRLDRDGKEDTVAVAVVDRAS